MMDDIFRKNLTELIVKHIPNYFMKEKSLNKIVAAICEESTLNRQEVLVLSYSVGANAEETDKLLEQMGYEKLYVKKREDAIWKFALRNRPDANAIVERVWKQ